MTSFLPPLSTATAPHNEIICPELRILGAGRPKRYPLRSLFLPKNPQKIVGVNGAILYGATVPNPLPIFHTLFDLYSTHCRGLC